jgi:hypothetical protein
VNVTINTKIQDPAVEIEPDRTIQIKQNPQVNWYRSGFSPQGCWGSGDWTGLEPNITVLKVQTQSAGALPGPIANSNYDTIENIIQNWNNTIVRGIIV